MAKRKEVAMVMGSRKFIAALIEVATKISNDGQLSIPDLKALFQESCPHPKRFVFYCSNSGDKRIDIDFVTHIMANGESSDLFIGKTRLCTISYDLRSIERQLQNNGFTQFLRIHRSCVVNTDHIIRKYGYASIEIEGCPGLFTIGRTYTQMFKERCIVLGKISDIDE